MEYPITLVSNGNELYGIYHECEDSKGIVLVCHGLGGTRVDVHRICVLFARELAKRQFSCLRIDLTGSGISHGSFLEFTFNQQYDDIQNILNWLRTNKKTNNLYLLGFSDGAIVAFNSGVLCNDVKGIVFWSPNFFENAKEKIEHNNRSDKRLFRVGDQLAWPLLGHWLYKDYFNDRDNELGRINFDNVNKKCLIVYGENDKDVKTGINKINNNLYEKIEIKGASHLYFSPYSTRQVIDVTANWLWKMSNHMGDY